MGSMRDQPHQNFWSKDSALVLFLGVPRSFCCAAGVQNWYREKTHLGCWFCELRKVNHPPLDLCVPKCTLEELLQVIWKTSASPSSVGLQLHWKKPGCLCTEAHPCLGSTAPSPSASSNLDPGIMERTPGQQSGDKFSSPYTQAVTLLTQKLSVDFCSRWRHR